MTAKKTARAGARAKEWSDFDPNDQGVILDALDDMQAPENDPEPIIAKAARAAIRVLRDAAKKKP